ncbi:MAG: aminotransferase class IV [Microscillaceae bacterium]|nr:aminotransferase class IV [Microscillaceae bacterium]
MLQHEASLPLTDLGVLRGLGVFDFLRTYHGLPFALEAHWRRLENSAQALGLALPHTLEEVQEIIDELLFLKEDKNQEIGFRMVLTGGEAAFGTFYQGQPNFFILSEAIRPHNELEYEKGIKVITQNYQRNFPEIKSTDYLATFAFQKKIEEAQANDVLYCFQNKVTECSRSNFFMVKGDTLISPKEHILLGITRQLVLEIAAGQMKVEERNIELQEVLEADEAFLTGTRAEVKPVIQIDNQLIGKARVGKYSKRLRKSLLEKIHEMCTSSMH